MKKIVSLPPIDTCFRAIDLIGAPQHIAALGVLKGTPSINSLISSVNKISDEFPRLKKRFHGSSAPYESEIENFDTSKQCFFHDFNCNLDELTEKASNILYQAFNNELPLWELHILCSKKIDNSILLFKLHHSFADGISGLYFYHRLLGAKKKREKIQEDSNSKLISSIKYLLKEVIIKRPNLPVNKKLSNRRKLLCFSLPNSNFIEIKKIHSCTSLSIALALAGYAMGHYLEDKGHRYKQFRALIPVTIRGKNYISDLGNKIGGASIFIPLELKNINEIIPKISSQLEKLLSTEAYNAYHLCAKIFKKFPLYLRKKSCHFASIRLNGICTFLQSPRENLSLDNCQLINLYAIPALLPEQGLSFGFLKMRDSMNISIVYDPEIISDAECLKNSINNAVNEFLGN